MRMEIWEKNIQKCPRLWRESTQQKGQKMETRVNVEEGKKYLYVETTEECIKQFKNAPEAERAGIEISKMRVEGVWVPAFKFAVETSTESGAQFYAD